MARYAVTLDIDFSDDGVSGPDNCIYCPLFESVPVPPEELICNSGVAGKCKARGEWFFMNGEWVSDRERVIIMRRFDRTKHGCPLREVEDDR